MGASGRHTSKFVNTDLVAAGFATELLVKEPEMDVCHSVGKPCSKNKDCCGNQKSGGKRGR